MGILAFLFGPNIDRLKKKNDLSALKKALVFWGCDIRVSAAEALGDIKDAKAVDNLIEALSGDWFAHAGEDSHSSGNPDSSP